MSIETTVERVMRGDFVRLSPATPAREAVAALVRSGSSAAIVLDDTAALVGILTERDCFRPMLNASYYQQWSGRVGDVMSREVQTLPGDLDLVSAAEEFLARTHRVYPVVKADEVVGLLHRADLLRAILAISEGQPIIDPADARTRDRSPATG